MPVPRSLSLALASFLSAFLLVAVLLVPGSASAQPDSPSSPSSEAHAEPEAHAGNATEDIAAAVRDSILSRAKTLDPLASLLVARGDSLRIEWYAPGQRAGEPVNIKSASKTILSAVIGLAIEDGHLDGPDQPIGPFFPKILDGSASGDSLKRTITLGDLMTMRAGLESTSFGNYGAWVSADSWVRDALDRPMVGTPGDGMIYSTGTSHLAAVMTEKAVGRDLRAYAQERLFDPMGVRIGAWQEDPEGYRFGGNNMALTPRGLLRFGQMYLRGGWVPGDDGERVQVVPVDWVGTSWRVRVLRSYRGFRYGYFWWFETFGGEPTFFAWGYGGQMLFVVPSLNLVTVMTSALTTSDQLRGHSSRLFQFCEEINRLVRGGG